MRLFLYTALLVCITASAAAFGWGSESSSCRELHPNLSTFRKDDAVLVVLEGQSPCRVAMQILGSGGKEGAMTIDARPKHGTVSIVEGTIIYMPDRTKTDMDGFSLSYLDAGGELTSGVILFTRAGLVPAISTASYEGIEQ